MNGDITSAALRQWQRASEVISPFIIYTKFRVNQKMNCPDISEKRFSLWRSSAMLNLQNCGTMSCDRPWKRNLRLPTKLR